MKDLKIYIVIGSVLVLFYLVAQYNKPTPVDWTESLHNSDKIPFGTYVLYNRLPDIFTGAKVVPLREPVYNALTEHGFKHATYIIVTNDLALTEYDYGKLTKFLRDGNDVFIAATHFGGYLEKELKIGTDKEYRKGKEITATKFVNPLLDSAKQYRPDKRIGEEYFNELDTAKATVLAKNDQGNSTYIKYTFGKGSLYLSVNPLLFTNYSLLQNTGAQYAATALSYVKTSDTVIWDQFYTLGRDGEESLMRVFLRNDALRWAYYLSLASLLLFVLFEIKRRQRIIPVIEPLRNSSIDFVNVVGQVYYEQRNNGNIAQKKATYLLEHIRSKYHLKTSLLNAEFVESLSHKTGIEAAALQRLLNQITIIRSGVYISDRDLISFNQNIEQFYIQSK